LIVIFLLIGLLILFSIVRLLYGLKKEKAGHCCVDCQNHKGTHEEHICKCNKNK